MARVTQALETPRYTAHLHRSTQRKSLGLKIQHGTVHVYAPLTLDLNNIHHWLQQKQAWIEKHLLRQQHLTASRQDSALRWQQGAAFQFLNTGLHLNINRSFKNSACIQNQQLTVYTPQLHPTATTLRPLVKQAYSQAGLAYVQARIQHWRPQLERFPSRIDIKEYKSRWGSCNARAEISFNWLLFQAPEAVVDYVIVHELCHLVHLNHSASFWQLVSRLCPQYLTHRNWLKHNGHHLVL